MENIKRLLFKKRNLINLVVVVLLLVALPVGIYLSQRTQIFKGRAALEPGTFTLNITGGCTGDPCTLQLSPNFPINIFISAYAQSFGVDLQRIEVWVAMLDENGDPPVNDDEWTLLANQSCFGGEGDACTIPSIQDSYSAADAGEWIYIMDVYYNDPDAGVQLWCSGTPNSEFWCGSNASFVVNARTSGGAATATPVPTQPTGGNELNLSVLVSDTCNVVSNSKSVNLTWNSVSGARYSVSRKLGVDGTSFALVPNNYTQTSFTDPSVTEGTYIYTVAAINAISGVPMGINDQVTVTIDCDEDGGIPIPTPPLTSCTITGPTSLVTGQTYGFNIGGVNANCSPCQWRVYTGQSPIFSDISQIIANLGNMRYVVYTPTLTGSQTIAFSNDGQLRATCSKQIIVSTSGGIMPTLPGGGIYPAPPGGGGSCTTNPECGACIAPTGQCGNAGRKQCTYTGPAGCTQVTGNAPPQVCDAGNTCEAGFSCSGGACVPPGGSAPPATPTPTTGGTPTGPVSYRVANSPGGSPSLCTSALNAAPSRSYLGPSISLSAWDLLTDSFNSQSSTKYICAQFYNASGGSILSSPLIAQINLISASQPTATPTRAPTTTQQPTPTGAPTTTQPTATTGPVSPTVTTTPGRTTAGYRIAENLTDLSGKIYLPYTTHPLNVTHTFSSSTPGSKQICVQFKASDGTQSTPTCSSIELVRKPQITSCNISSVAGSNNVEFEITGNNFGSSQTGASITAAVNVDSRTLNTILNVGQWTDDKVIAKFVSAPSGQPFAITLTTASGLTAQGACSSISQLAIGAQLFCPQVKDVTIPDTEVTIIEATSSGRVFTEKVSLKVLKANNVGVIEGLRTRLQEGRAYKLAIKVPRGVRRVLNNLRGGFVALPGTTNVDFTRDGNGAKLPLGDIFPVSVGDGAINSADFTQLKRDISAGKAATNSYSDLNLDNWVNSFEWACMRPEIGTSDEEVPGAGPLN